MSNSIKMFLTGVGGKVAIVMLVLTALTAASIGIGYFASDRVSQRLEVVSQQDLPNLQHSVGLIATNSAMQETLNSLLVAENTENLRVAAADLERIRSEVEALEAETVTRDLTEGAELTEAELVSQKFTQALSRFESLVTIREQEFANLAEIEQAVTQLRELSKSASTMLSRQSDVVYFEVVVAGRQTSNTVNDTLHRIVEKDFRDIRLSLEIDGEINLIAGVVLALPEVDTAGMTPVLKEMGQLALANLEKHLEEAEEVEMLADILPDLKRLAGLFGTQLNSVAGFGLDVSDVIYDTREDVDAVLRMTIGVLLAGLQERVDVAATENQDAVQALMSNQVSAIRELASLDALVNRLVGIAFEVAVAGSAEDLSETTARLSSEAATLQRLSSDLPDEMKQVMQDILTISDPEQGLPDLRDNVLTWRADTELAAQQVAMDVREITRLTQAEGNEALHQIEAAQTELSSLQADVRFDLILIAIAAVVVIIPVQFLTWLTIVRPMRLLSRATDGLAGGDLSATDNLKFRAGEVGEMTRALRVFRDNIVENNRLKEEEMREHARRIESEKTAREEKQAREEEQRQRQQEREQQERARREAEAKRENELREAAAAEEQRQREEQDLLVSTLAEGLTKLASGDLRAKITQEFPEAYEQLREDFNRTAEALEEIIGTIANSVGTISGDSTEIANSASELSTRTEQSVEMLLQTSAAIEQMTISVQSASQGAEQADAKVRDARAEAEKSGEIVSEASVAMGEIESSSDAISQIISVIEGIAFQTNLLALNAGVEAARAGEAGRGFAVVASEVRALAQRSSEAAHEIEELITKSGEQVKKGVQLVARAGQALEGISYSVVEVSSHVTDIATSAKEQAQGIGEVNVAVTKLEGFAQQNAAMFEETTAASHSLKQEANTLSEIVSKFEGTDTEEVSEIRGGNDTAETGVQGEGTAMSETAEMIDQHPEDKEKDAANNDIGDADGWFEVGETGEAPEDVFATSKAAGA